MARSRSSLACGPGIAPALLLGLLATCACDRQNVQIATDLPMDAASGDASDADGQPTGDVVSDVLVDVANDGDGSGDGGGAAEAHGATDTGASDTTPTRNCAMPVIDIPVATPPGIWLKASNTLEVDLDCTVQLHGGNSKASSAGKVISWNWYVKQEPVGSKVKLLGGHSSDQVLEPTELGLYVICLSVIDAAKQPGCKHQCVKLEVYPPPGIYVELSWQTTGDTDPTDEGPGAGADLDLHLAHKFAKHPSIQDQCKGAPYPWFDKKFDAWAGNPQPKWGQALPQVKDDPLLVDNADGTAPERLRLLEPESAGKDQPRYTIGVHYWNDHGFGPSVARVQVFIERAPVVDVYRTMNPADMWTLGQIWWPHSLSGGTSSPWLNCWQIDEQDPCTGGSGPWQKEGVPCVNACFLPGFGTPGEPTAADCK